MKTFITAILCAAILFCGPRLETKAQLGPALLILTCAAVATCIIIRVMAHNDQQRVHRLVLQKSPTLDGQNWVSLATNDFNLTPEEFFPAFAARMGKAAEYYRVIEIPIPPGGNIRVMTTTVMVP